MLGRDRADQHDADSSLLRRWTRAPLRSLRSWLRRRRRQIALVLEDGASPRILFDDISRLFRQTRRAFHRMLRRYRRSGPGGGGRSRRGGVANPRVGRNVRIVPYRDGRHPLAPIPTVLRAARAGRSRRGVATAPFLPRFRRADLAGWDKVEHESLTLVLVVDVSRSSFPYMGVFVGILESLAGYFHRNRDRMGLIALQGAQAQVMNHPTHNYRVVTRNMAKLEIRGHSPLADGLLKALAMARLERFRNAGSRSLVVLLSDCFPEPITGGLEDLFEEESYRAAILAAQIYRREQVNLLILHPWRPVGRDPMNPQDSPGTRLARTLARVSGGRLIPLRGREGGGRISRREIDLVLGGIEAAYLSGRRGAYDPFAPGGGARALVE